MKLFRCAFALALGFVMLAGAACAHSPTQQAPVGGPPNVGDPLSMVRQQALPLKWPDQGDSPGLEELKRIVGDARVVMIGEPWHGDGAAIRLRAELVRYLHMQLGFDVLAFEADFFGVTRGWEKAVRTRDVDRFAADNIYPFWATSAAARPLWQSVAEFLRDGKPLSVTGIDPKHLGMESRRQLPGLMDSLLTEHTDLVASQRQHFLEMLSQYLRDEQRYRPSRADQRPFFAALDALQEAFSVLPPAERNTFAAHEVDNLRSAVEYSWRGASRDRAMGNNLAWIATQLYPGKKIVVWAHNNHIATSKWMYFSAPDSGIRRSVAKLSVGDMGRFTYMGEEAKEFFGPGMVSVAFVSDEGHYTPDIRTNVDPSIDSFERGNFDSVAILSPAPKGSVEATLAASRFDLAVLDLRPFRKVGVPLKARVFDYTVTPPLSMRYWEGYDALVFVRSTFGLNEVGPSSPRP